MNVLFSRHNGMGDVVMALPFALAAARAGHVVAFETEPSNHDWLRLVAGPWLAPLPLVCNPYDDFRAEVPGYDRFVNLNRLELLDEWRTANKRRARSQQEAIADRVLLAGLPVPPSLSPAGLWEHGLEKGSEVLVFSKSTSPSRAIGPKTLEKILEKFPGATVDPHYGSKVELLEAVARAKGVLAADSGPVHLAELCGTKWTCFHTTFDEEARHARYAHGICVQSRVPCSPCFLHGGCAAHPCTDDFGA